MSSISGYTRGYVDDPVTLGESLQDRILSVRGDRFFQPTYGTLIQRTPPGIESQAQAIAEVQSALNAEPRYIVDDVRVEVLFTAGEIIIDVDGVYQISL